MSFWTRSWHNYGAFMGMHEHLKLNVLIVDNSKNEHYFIRTALSKYRNISFNSLSGTQSLISFLFKTGSYSSSDRQLPDIIILNIHSPVLIDYTLMKGLNRLPVFRDITFLIMSDDKTDSFRHSRNSNLNYCSKNLSVENFRNVFDLIVHQHLNNETYILS